MTLRVSEVADYEIPPGARSGPIGVTDWSWLIKVQKRGWGKESIRRIARIGQIRLVENLLSEQLLCDHDALNLVGPLVDLGDLGIAHETLRREVGRIPVSPEQLDSIGRHRHRSVRSEALRHRSDHRKLAVGVARVNHAARAI